MAKPKIKIQLKPLDYLLDIGGWLGVLFLFLIPAYYYSQLPDLIPSHFGLDGTPDRFSSKTHLWIVPVIAALMFLGLFLLSRIPHLYNYPVAITEENAVRKYHQASRLIRWTNALLVFTFLYINQATIHTALGNQEGFSVWFVPATLTLGLISGLFAVIFFAR